MKSKKIIAYAASLAAIILLLTSFIKADDDLIKKIITRFSQYTSDYPQEKVYLHLDKPYYAAGESIWFKAYITVDNHQLSSLSGILNVELINEDDSVKQSLRIPLAGGMGWGDFALNDTVKQGNYRIRAYTNWMRNAGSDCFFDKTIFIGNAIDNKVFTKTSYQYSTQNGQQKVDATINYASLDGMPYTGKEVSYQVQFNSKNIAKGKSITDDKGNIALSFYNKLPVKYNTGRIITNIKIAGKDKDPVTKILEVKAAPAKADVQFFPESGSLVKGIRSRVAFKAVGPDGLGEDIKGVVKDNEGHDVAQFSSQHLGMGVFALMPQSGKTYKATVSYPDGSQSTIDLPAAADKGYVLSVNTLANPDSIIVRIIMDQSEGGNDKGINLVIQSGGIIHYAAKGKLNGAGFTAMVPKKIFPAGIAQFTLFADSGDPLCERIAFIKNPGQLNLNITSAKNTYAPRGHVQVDLTATDKDGKAVSGGFSAAVIDESKVKTDEDAESTILSTLLLTSDLKGYIEKPNYYFTGDKAGADLDVLMMTQGYRRFEWKQIMGNTLPPLLFKPERTIDITGHLTTPGGKPIAGGKVTLFTTMGGTFLVDTTSDEKGNFVFKDLVFKDSIRFVIQARTAKDRKNVQIDLDNITPQPASKNKNAPDMQITVGDVMSNYLQNSKKQYAEDLKYGIGNHTRVLKEVTIKDKKPVFPNSSNLNGPGNADQVVKGDQVLQGCARLADCLQGRLLGVIFRNGVPYSTRSPNIKMGIVIDGVSFNDPDFINNIDPNNIESIEVLRSGAYTAIYGSIGAGGVLLINTKRGASYSYQRYAPGIITYAPMGYHVARQFYSPRYDDPKTNTEAADLRTTIFWKPNMITGADGKASFDFFNADSKGTYRIVVEGMDADGNLGRQVYRYKVE